MDTGHNQSRRAFLGRTGGVATACAVMGLAGGNAAAAPSAPKADATAAGIRTVTDQHYRLTNVRLEEGFDYDNDIVTGTRTALHTLEIKAGRIVALHSA